MILCSKLRFSRGVIIATTNCRKKRHTIVLVFSFKVNWTVAESNGAATLSENQFLMRSRWSSIVFFK